MADSAAFSDSPSRWQFAIDVGGTFTDVLATAPTGEVHAFKLLSSGVFKGQASANSSSEQIFDRQRANDPPNFWKGSQLTLVDQRGQQVAASLVASSQPATEPDGPGQLTLETPFACAIEAGPRYELSTGFDAPVLAIRYLLGLTPDQPVPPVDLRLGTTRGTNALLTRTGARCALVTTRGFGDLLKIGYQDRPHLFDLAIRKPQPLTEQVLEVDARVSSEGDVLRPLKEQQVRRDLQALKTRGVESLAICLLHADLYPEHEQAISRLATEAGFNEVSCSHEVSPLVKLIARAETTVVDAYLNPVLREYLDRLAAALPSSKIRLMTSSGGLTTAEHFRGCESVLSGPAGGVIGYAQSAEQLELNRAIGFDMGGTSTDVSRFAGEYEQDFEVEKAGVRLMTPTLAIETIAAGGGSVCWFDGIKICVGPDSAGADPGPACYGRGGPLTVTDMNLFLGRLLPESFPFSLDLAATRRQLTKVAKTIAQTTGEQLSEQDLAEGFLKVANASMAEAIRNVTVARGTWPAGHVLIPFGGAAAQHACDVANEIGIRRILHHPHAGVMSAHGIGLAAESRHRVVGIYRSLEEMTSAAFESAFAELEDCLFAEFAASGTELDQLTACRTIELRYQGVDASMLVSYDQNSLHLKQAFEAAHQQSFGYLQAERAIEVVALRVEVSEQPCLPTPSLEEVELGKPVPDSQREVILQGQRVLVDCYHRDRLAAGDTLMGPALIVEPHTAIVVLPTWELESLVGGELLLSHNGKQQIATHRAEAVKLEVFNNQLVGIATRMGHVLRRTAVSVNVKERLDYSCAVFTAAGRLVANAPHVPVHLGAMGVTVRSILNDNPKLQPGDVFVSNDPYRGGSHLPDVTVVLPIFSEPTSANAKPELLFCTACRAHHAEIGGIRPGSMPPTSSQLGDEGVLISNFLLTRDGHVFEDELRKLLASGSHPSRNIEENLADLHAQVAAVNRGANDLRKLVSEYGRESVFVQMEAIQKAAERKARQSLEQIKPGRYEFTDAVENAEGDQLPICVAITIAIPQEDDAATEPAAVFDFLGTAAATHGNLNANPAIVTSAVLYVLRLLIDEDIPLNEGVLNAVEIVLPTCLLNPDPKASPHESPAVVAGNVETSQRIVDVLLGALGLAAASQGTMNNVLFGNEEFGYYETLGGGSGATRECAGADAVQVHMTNTRCTDPEILERRYPVRLWEMSIRQASGGQGQQLGGHGMTRRLEFLAPLELSLLTQRRGDSVPFGLEGGQSGSAGLNRLIKQDGSVELLPPICQRHVDVGDQLEIHTPGGGGFGTPSP